MPGLNFVPGVQFGYFTKSVLAYLTIQVHRWQVTPLPDRFTVAAICLMHKFEIIPGLLIHAGEERGMPDL